MLWALTQRELQAAGEKLGHERGLSFYTPVDGGRISGTYTGAVQLVSGKFAIVEKSREFTLVPWRPVIEKELGAGRFRGSCRAAASHGRLVAPAGSA
jgi:uncharacterized protein DUF3363